MVEKEKLSRREREKLMQREEIFNAALELFSEKGYHNVSMHEIAKRSEFAIGTLYKFFENKEKLYKALMMKKAETFHNTMMKVLDGSDDIITLIKKLISVKAQLFADNLQELRLYFAETRGASFNIKSGLDRDIRKMYQEFIMHLASVLKTGVQENIFRDIDPYHMAVALDGLANSFLFCWLENPDRYKSDTNVSIITDLFLNGVLSEDKKNSVSSARGDISKQGD